MNDRLLSFLGLCRRAKKLCVGAEVCEKSIAGGKSLLVLFAADAAPNSLKRVSRAAEQRGIPVLRLPREKRELSVALGRLSAVLSVEDKGFADKLRQMIETEQRGEFDDKI